MTNERLPSAYGGLPLAGSALEGVGTDLKIDTGDLEVAGKFDAGDGDEADSRRLAELTAEVARLASVRQSAEAGSAPDRDLTLERVDAELVILRGRVAAFAPRVPRPQRHV